MKKKILSILALSLVLGVGLASCAPAEPSVTVTQGEKGDTGPTGPKGDTGEKGDTGPIGPSGENGSDGKDGEKGDTGPTGDKGDTGPAGQDGEDGETAYSSTMLPVVGGYVTVDVGSATVGTPVTFTAIPEEGYRPVAVTLNGERHELSKDNGFKLTVNMVEGGFVVRGEFKIEKLVTSVEITAPESDTLFINGKSLTLEAKVLPEDATDTRIVWSSSDEKVATVDEKGVVTPVGVGEVTIRATAKDDETKFAEQKLTVRYTTIAEAKEAVIANGNAETPTKTVDVTVAGVVQATWYDGAIIEDASGSMWIYGKNLGLTVGSYVEAVGGIQNYSHGYELANPEVTVLDLEKPEITATHENWGAEQFTSWYNSSTTTTDKNEWYTINKIKFESRLVVDGNYVNGYIPGFTTTLSLKIDDDVKATINSGSYYALEGYVYGTDTNKTFVYVGISKLTPLAMPEATVLTVAEANQTENLYRRAVVSGQVKAIYDDGFILADSANDFIGYYEYGFEEANAALSDGLKVGEFVMVTGFIDQYNGTNQFTSEATITKLNSGSEVELTATELNDTQLVGLLEEFAPTYAKFTAKYSGGVLRAANGEVPFDVKALGETELVDGYTYELVGFLSSITGDNELTLILTATPVVIDVLEVSADKTTLVKNETTTETAQITAQVVPAKEDAKYTFTAEAGKENVLTVDQTGKVTAVGGGTAKVTVTATYDTDKTLTQTIEFKVVGEVILTPKQFEFNTNVTWAGGGSYANKKSYEIPNVGTVVATNGMKNGDSNTRFTLGTNNESNLKGTVPAGILKGAGLEVTEDANKVGSNYYAAMYTEFDIVNATGITVKAKGWGTNSQPVYEFGLSILYSTDKGITWSLLSSGETAKDYADFKGTIESETGTTARFAVLISGESASNFRVVIDTVTIDYLA